MIPTSEQLAKLAALPPLWACVKNDGTVTGLPWKSRREAEVWIAGFEAMVVAPLTLAAMLVDDVDAAISAIAPDRPSNIGCIVDSMGKEVQQ